MLFVNGIEKVREHIFCSVSSIPKSEPLTGELYAAEPHVRFGG